MASKSLEDVIFSNSDHLLRWQAQVLRLKDLGIENTVQLQTLIQCFIESCPALVGGGDVQAAPFCGDPSLVAWPLTSSSTAQDERQIEASRCQFYKQYLSLADKSPLARRAADLSNAVIRVGSVIYSSMREMWVSLSSPSNLADGVRVSQGGHDGNNEVVSGESRRVGEVDHPSVADDSSDGYNSVRKSTLVRLVSDPAAADQGRGFSQDEAAPQAADPASYDWD